jgi:hypothetical protein
MAAKMEKPACGARAIPVTDLAAIDPENIPSRPLSQEEAWKLAVTVFGSDLPAPRRDICGTSVDGIRYWRAASR